jgi:hypothetical protein
MIFAILPRYSGFSDASSLYPLISPNLDPIGLINIQMFDQIVSCLIGLQRV